MKEVEALRNEEDTGKHKLAQIAAFSGQTIPKAGGRSRGPHERTRWLSDAPVWL